MCVVDRAKVSSSYFFLILVSFIVFDYNGAETLTSCDSAPSNLRIDMVNVTYINQSAVNITWTPVFGIENYTIQGYTVEYSSVSVTTVKGRCNGSEFFNENGDLTSFGVISGLSEEYDGYGFTVLIETTNGTLGDDVTPIIGLRNDNIIPNSATDPPANTSDPNGVPVQTIVTVIVCIIGTFILYTCVLFIAICCYRKSQIQIKRLKKEVMAVNELDFPNPATIGDASEYKVTPLYPLDVAISSSDHQSSATADGERESTFADKGESSVE